MLDQNADACFYGKAVKMNLSFFRILRRVACAFLVSGLVAIRVVAQTNNAALAVGGSVEEPLTLSISDLRAMPRVTVKAAEKGGSEATFEGVSLYEVVMRAKPKLSAHCCSNEVNTVVIVKAADNYQAAFSLPELDPKFGNHKILIADEHDGQPLNPKKGPLEIIAPDDKVYSRWVRQANFIEVLPVGNR
jgi:DMSO/TMAO reductase YedYZ molybdopterin-dependent catalytic subunit